MRYIYDNGIIAESQCSCRLPPKRMCIYCSMKILHNESIASSQPHVPFILISETTKKMIINVHHPCFTSGLLYQAKKKSWQRPTHTPRYLSSTDKDNDTSNHTNSSPCVERPQDLPKRVTLGYLKVWSKLSLAANQGSLVRCPFSFAIGLNWLNRDRLAGLAYYRGSFVCCDKRVNNYGYTS